MVLYLSQTVAYNLIQFFLLLFLFTRLAILRVGHYVSLLCV